jgi:hypothetical protein
MKIILKKLKKMKTIIERQKIGLENQKRLITQIEKTNKELARFV